MKHQNRKETEVAEKIAEVALLRTGLVSIEQSHKSNIDLIIRSKADPDKTILVEVKNYTSRMGREQIMMYCSQFPDSTIFLFFINTSDETGYFEIVDHNKLKGQYELTMSSLTYHLNQSLNSFRPMEYPPYTFNDTKYDVRVENFDDGFKILRLINLTLSPFEKSTNSYLEIQIVGRDFREVKTIYLNKLFHNPNLPNFLFFINEEEDTEHTDIVLPEGQKSIYIQLHMPGNTTNKNFEMKLSCRYLKNSSEMSY